MTALARCRDWLFGPHERPERAESFTPRRRPSELWCILWHRLGVRCQAHALGLEAYYRTYNTEKRDDWVPEIREVEDGDARRPFAPECSNRGMRDAEALANSAD